MKNRKIEGFMGLTHTLLSISLLLVCILIPFEPFQLTFGKLRESWILMVAGLTVCVGGALFPDLDNDQSSAGHTLGVLGSIFTIFMKSTSSIVWNVYHFKADQRPTTQHRYLWHAPIIGLGLCLLFYFGLPTGEYTIFTNLSNSIQTGQVSYFFQTNAILTLFIILMFMAILVGANMILYRLGNIFPIPPFVKYIFPVLMLGYIFTTTYTNLKILGVCFGAGYLFHCLEDCFADTGIPSLIFPIPQFWRKKVWGRMRLTPITIQTGSMMNTVLDFIALGVMIFLLVIVFRG